MKLKKNATKETTLKILESCHSPAGLIRQAISGGADLEKLEKLLELQERWEKNEAKKAYNADMVLAQNKMPSVAKTLTNPQTHSKYASLDEIVKETKKIYTTYGFSMSFNEGVTDKPEHIRICGEVAHKLGHKESYFYDVPLDGLGIKGNPNMTRIHAKASSTSYGRRYLTCMIWNIATGDDNDGNNRATEKTKMEVSENGDIKTSSVEAEVVL